MNDGRVFAAAQILFQCPECKGTVAFDLPTYQGEYKQLAFFGDEAARLISPNITMNVYALVALGQNHLKHVLDKLYSVKKIIWPNNDPSKWHLHASDVRIMEWRRDRGIEIPTWRVNDLLAELCRTVASNEREKLITVSVLPPCRSAESQDRIYEVMLAVSLIATTQRSTSTGFTPRYFLEATTLDHENNHIDYVVEKVSRGLRTSLSYLYAGRGIAIGLPTTLPKGARPELEIADLVAFTACRHLFREYNGRQAEIPVNLLGLVYWNVVGANGFRSEVTVGFPWSAEPDNTNV
jgi:hypothetical protein